METDSAFLSDFCDCWLAAWNSHETGRVLELLSDDIVWDDLTFWPTVIEGRAGVEEYVERIWQVMPDVRFTERARFYSPDHAQGVVLFQQSGSAPPRFASHPGFDSHGCDIFLRFAEGRLAHYLASYDITEMMRQMQMLPARNGRVGGSYLMSLNQEAPR